MYHHEEPFFCPNLFAGVVLSAERLIVEVWWKEGMVCQTLPFQRNRFLSGGDNLIEIEGQNVLAIVGVLLEGRRKKRSNGSCYPVNERILPCNV